MLRLLKQEKHGYGPRKGIFPIVGLSVVGTEEDYETVAVVINEDNQIEAINIEGFEVEEGITNIIGCYLEYWEDENEEYDGRIIKVVPDMKN